MVKVTLYYEKSSSGEKEAEFAKCKVGVAKL
jgi:hypothetical protein